MTNRVESQTPVLLTDAAGLAAVPFSGGQPLSFRSRGASPDALTNRALGPADLSHTSAGPTNSNPCVRR